MNPALDEALGRLDRRWGGRCSTAGLDAAPQFAPYYGTGQWIKVDGPGGVRFGWVSMTTGRAPVFLLVPRENSLASTVVLTGQDGIVAVRRSRHGPYIPVNYLNERRDRTA